MLDAVDKQILGMLLDCGRISYTDISKAVGMKPPSVIDRIKKMESDGIIKGYTTNVDYKKLGYDLSAYVGVVIDDSEHVGNFETTVGEIDDSIVQCYHVTGDFTILLKVITENTSTLAALIKKIRSVKGVTKTNTILIFNSTLERVRKINV